MKKKRLLPPSSFRAKARIQEGKAGMVNELRFLPAHRNDAFVVIPPACCRQGSRGNVLHKPLDSGFRRNDDEGNGHDPLIFDVIPAPVILAPFGLLPVFSFLPLPHSSLPTCYKLIGITWNPR